MQIFYVNMRIEKQLQHYIHMIQYKRNSSELTKQNDDGKQQNTNNNLFNIQDVLF